MSKKNFENSSNTKYQLEHNSCILNPETYTKDKIKLEALQMNFIRKVYAVLLLRFVITFGFVSLFTLNPNIQFYADRNPILVAIIIIFATILFGYILFSKSSIRSHSTNLILIGFYDLVESVLMSFIGAVYAPRIIFMTIILTICVLVVLILLTFLQKKRFLSKVPWILTISIMVEIITGAIFFRNELLKLIISCILTKIYIIYLHYPPQEITTEKAGNGPSADDFLIVALSL